MIVSASITTAFSQPAPPVSIDSTGKLLLEKYEKLKPQLTNNIFHRPLVFESTETSDSVNSAVYAVLNAPFKLVSNTFKQADLWCEVLILHINTKYCQTGPESVKPASLVVNIGKKTPQQLADTFLLEFKHQVMVDLPNNMTVFLNANKGPMNTTDYRLELHAIPLPDQKTFISLRYSYKFGLAGKLAMQTYLSTLGRNKVGFSKSGIDDNSTYIGGVRGAIERNTMRYYLAIEAYLAASKQSQSTIPEARFNYWYDATEEYSLQLHEVDRPSYLSMKKDEYLRQLKIPSATR